MTTQQTALVTGANKGIGFETARRLAQQGFVVWLGSRDRDRGEAAAKELTADGDVRFVQLDVTDPVSIEAAHDRLDEEVGALDVLINNAGVALGEGDGAPSTVETGTIRKTLDVNFYGTLHVTQAFLPLVRRADAGRIVNVSSSMGSLTMLAAPEQPLASFGLAYAYATSKTLVNTLTGWFAAELRDTPVKVGSVCPGFNATELNGNTGTQHPSEGAKVVVRVATLPADSPSGTFLDADGLVGW